jgi:hypothetical protein
MRGGVKNPFLPNIRLALLLEPVPAVDVLFGGTFSADRIWLMTWLLLADRLINLFLGDSSFAGVGEGDWPGGAGALLDGSIRMGPRLICRGSETLIECVEVLASRIVPSWLSRARVTWLREGVDVLE